MRPILAHTAAILFLVAGLSAAERPGNLSAQQRTSKANTTKAQPAQTSKARAVKGKAQAKRHGRGHSAYQVGRASWYGKSFHGKKTASGERYDMFQFTAAHPSLPLGSYIKVTNLRNSQWVVVKVNDRGPVPAGRIIDLSYGAAQMLGLRARGVEQVRLDLVQTDTLASLGDTTLGGGQQ